MQSFLNSFLNLSFLKRFLVCLLFFLLCVTGAAAYLEKKYVVPVVMYHHIQTVGEHNKKDALNSVSPESFEKQLNFIKKKGYRVLSMDEFILGLNNNNKLPKRSVVITFDDGYDNNYLEGFPVLRKYDFPATIFLVSDLVETQGYVTWPQVKEMSRHRITFGSHTRRHAYLPDLRNDPLKLQDEIAQSKQIIAQKLGLPVYYFCYPIGGFSDEVKEVVKKSGYLAAFSTNRGRHRGYSDLYELKRIRFKDTDTSDWNLWIKLSGYYNLLRKTKEPY